MASNQRASCSNSLARVNAPVAVRRSPGFGLCGDRYKYRGNAGGAGCTILTGLVSTTGGALVCAAGAGGGAEMGLAFGGSNGVGFTFLLEPGGGSGVTPFSSYFFSGAEE